MGLKLMKIVLMLLILSMKHGDSFAGWAGPVLWLSGSWGESAGQFAIRYQDTSEIFPTTITVSPSGKIAISEDQTLKRVQLFNNGMFERVVETFAFDMVFNTNGELFVTGGGLRKYDSEGNLVWSNPNVSFAALYRTNDGNIIGYNRNDKKFSLYSPAGQLMKASAERPLELGKVKSMRENSDGTSTTVIEFNDTTYNIRAPRLLEYFSRDISGGFYGAIKTGPGGQQFYRIYKYNRCGREIGSVNLLPNIIEENSEIGRPTPEINVVEEYGKPVIAPNGDVYTWKRTPDKYSILKWTWVDDPNVPTGPDAPTGLTLMPSTTGLYLTWTASPSDPGCVTWYEVARATSAGGATTTVATVNAGVIKYNDTTADAGTTYYYKVRVKAGSEYSPYTSEVSGKR